MGLDMPGGKCISATIHRLHTVYLQHAAHRIHDNNEIYIEVLGWESSHRTSSLCYQIKGILHFGTTSQGSTHECFLSTVEYVTCLSSVSTPK